MVKKIFSIAVLIVVLAGCKASLYDLPESSLVPNITDWKVYENSEVGLRFRYPAYFGDPNTEFVSGKQGRMFRVSFSYGQNEEDEEPFVYYVAGAGYDFEPSNMLERTFYKGLLATRGICGNMDSVLDFVQYAGESCSDFALNESKTIGKLTNVAISDLTGNSVEAVILANRSDETEFRGVQSGFRVPQFYVGFGEKSVVNMLKKLDKGNPPKDLVDELRVFKIVSESIQFLTD